MIKPLHLAVLALLVPVVASADPTGEAEALFDRGMVDLNAGNLEPACNELAASLAKLSDSGTKGALATCYDKLGKVASAWQLWRELADTAPTPDMRTSATQNATALEPQLPRYVVKATSVAGLVVTVNGAVVDLTVGVPLPVDPGAVAVTAKAPGHRDWTGTAQATASNTTTIIVPELTVLPQEPSIPPMTMVEDDHVRHRRRTIAVGVAIGAGATLAASLTFGGFASSRLSTAKRDCGGNLDACPGSQFPAAHSAFESANTAATVSDVLFAVGGAAVTAAAVIWFTAPAVEMKERPRQAWHVVPSAGPRCGALTLSGSW
jgi:hypothetical protein